MTEPKRTNKRCSDAKERGSLIPELALVLTLFLGLAFGTVQVCRYLKVKQIATSLSRELASLVYRECVAENSAFPNPRAASWPAQSNRARFDPRACIPAVIAEEFQSNAQRIAPGLTFDISLYNFDGTAVHRDYPTSSPTARSRFSVTRAQAELTASPSAQSDFTSSLVQFRHLVVAEIHIPFLSIGPSQFQPSILNSVYAVTVL